MKHLTTKNSIALALMMGLVLAGLLGSIPAVNAAIGANALTKRGEQEGPASNTPAQTAQRIGCVGTAANGSCSDGFTEASTDPTGVDNSSVAWGDYDDDGDLDILLAGYDGSDQKAEVWRNDGGSTFTQASTSPTGVSGGGVAWGDYDDDGDLDILLAGGSSGGPTTELWRNDSGGTFTQASTSPTAVSNSSVAWGDYDDDGDLDILLAGYTGSSRVTEVWRNDACGFTQAITDPTGVSDSSVAWGDYDNDGDLDILLAGYTGSDRTTEVWRNTGTDTFTQTSISLTGVSESSVAWGDYDDDGDLDILLAGWTSSSRVTEVWRNDGSDTFTLASTDPTGVRNGSVAWGDYDDDGDLDFLLAGWSSGGPTTEVWRNDGGGTFAQASTDPTAIHYGSVAWGDYDDDGDLDILLAGNTGSTRVTEVWRNDGSDTFTQASTDPTGVYRGDVAWGDYDDDGDLDILLAGYTGSSRVTEVWRNEGTGTFTQTSISPTAVDYSSVAWGDYDHDGDLDILVAGDTGSGYVTEVWRNDRSDTFTLVTDYPTNDPTGVRQGSVAWGDYDDDGDLDFLLAGYTGSNYVTEVWRNNGADFFSQASTHPTGIRQGGVAWGDYDDDGDIDILLAGYTGSTTRATEVWRNEGGGTFTLAITDATGVSDSSVAWGDYDDDGDLDILLAGHNGSDYVTEVWRSECFQVYLPLVLR